MYHARARVETDEFVLVSLKGAGILRALATGKERRGTINMKYFALTALAVMALAFGGCASQSESTTTTSSAATTSYSK